MSCHTTEMCVCTIKTFQNQQKKTDVSVRNRPRIQIDNRKQKLTERANSTLA